MTKKVAILQSNYIPWKGYFDLIAAVDEFIIYDDVQYTKNDWRNRNILKTPTGPLWLTVPTGTNIRQRIRDVSIDTPRWQVKHWKTLDQYYRKAPYFSEIARWLEPLYMEETYSNLSAMNRRFIEAICAYLGIVTTISNSWDYTLTGDKTERLVGLCRQAGAAAYISGPAARSYLDESAFAAAGLTLVWFNYDGYPVYPQLYGEFTHQVSVLDLLFMCGKKAPDYLRYVRQ